MLLMLVVVFSPLTSTAQYPDYVRHHAEILSADSLHGRGYVLDGLEKAEKHIANEFRSLGLLPLGDDYRQVFHHAINRFPRHMDVSVGKRTLQPGIDYLIDPSSPLMVGDFKVKWIDPTKPSPPLLSRKMNKCLEKDGVVVAIDMRTVESKEDRAIAAEVSNYLSDRVDIIKVSDDKLTWGASTHQSPEAILQIRGEAMGKAKKVQVSYEVQLDRQFRSANVLGYIEGTAEPDSFMVFTAHYDHLGMMGQDATFNGANDNASGTAVMMSLAKYYSENPPPYSCVFIAFAGEEAGLLGSKYFVENPLVPLSQMRFLINLDLFASGVDGITVVNGTEVPRAYQLLVDINEEKELLPLIKKRGQAANSDHYFFDQMGVPSIFIYALGGNAAYHDVHDTYEKLTFEEYPDIFRLITAFVERY